MTSESLAKSYLKKAVDRLEILDVLLRKEAYSDVVCEAQEIVELAMKGMLRAVGIEPPKVHDVGNMVLEHRHRFAEHLRETLPALAVISKELRKDRELAFYGDVDFIPTEEYSLAQAEQAREGALRVVDVAQRVIGPV
ncbi:HEPN domain-containing protein [Candidatus Nitrospira bockiana]